MKRLYTVAVFMLMIGLFLSTGQSQASNLDWKTYETEHFVIFFHEGYEFQAQETAYYLEQSYDEVRELTGNDRKFKTRIVIQDVGIESNGFADPTANKIAVFTNTPQYGVLQSYQNWFRLVGGHELTHIQHMTNYSGVGAIPPFIFGDFMAPNVHVPMWIIEGVTVYRESQLSPYEGRLNDGYYDAVLAAKASAGAFPSILEANYIHSYYPIGQFYLFGGTFVRYLTETYGEEKLTAFFDQHGRHPFPLVGRITPALGIDLAAQKVYGKPFDILFKEWEAAEVAKHKDWRMDGQMVLANEARGTINSLLTYDGKLYYTRLDVLGAKPAQLEAAISLAEFDPATGEERILKEFPTGVMGKIQQAQGKLYYLLGEVESGFANVDQLGLGATGLLYSYDLATGKTELLLKEGMKAFEILPNGEILYTKDQRELFGTEVWKYADGEKSLLGTFDQKVAEIEANEEQVLIVSRKNLGSWNINRLNLTDLSLEPLVDTPWSESVIALYGDQVYFSGNYDHEWSLYSYDLNTQKVNKLTEGGYAFNGVQIQNQVYYKGILADGEAIFTKEITPVAYQLGEREVVTPEPIAEFAKGLEEQDGFGKNLSYMAIPNVRFIPFAVAGQDGLGTTQYLVGLAPDLGLNLEVTTTFAQPLQMSVSSQNVSGIKRVNRLDLAYPLYNSAQYGLTNLTVGGAIAGTQDLSGTLAANFRARSQFINLQLTGSLQGGAELNLGYRHRFRGKDLSLQTKLFTGMDKIVESQGDLTWLEDVRGVEASGEFTFKVAEVRKGIWNTTLFAEDLYGGAFADFSSLDGGQFSAGVNCQLELGMGFLLNTIPELGVRVDHEGDIRPYFNFGIGL